MTRRWYSGGTSSILGHANMYLYYRHGLLAMEATLSETFQPRLEAAIARLQELCMLQPEPGARTAPERDGSEQWEWGQVWAHLAEFPGYWNQELQKALDGARQFGRTKADPDRIAALAAYQTTDVATLCSTCKSGLAETIRILATCTADHSRLVSRHPTLGPMTMDHLVEEFLAGHVEEHIAQLEGLLSPQK